MSDRGGALSGLPGRIVAGAVVVAAPLVALAVGAAIAAWTAAPADRGGEYVVLGSALVGIAITVAGTVTLLRGVARPLTRLRAAVEDGTLGSASQPLASREDEIGALARALAAAAERSEQQRAAVEDLTMRDAETGLYGARELRVRLETEVGRARRHGRTLTLMVASVDGRTTLAEHQARAIARLLIETLRPTDVAARASATRFAALLPETDDLGARTVAGRLRDAVAALPDGLAVSIGLAAFPGDAGNVEQLAQAADDALAVAAARGGSGVQHYGST